METPSNDKKWCNTANQCAALPLKELMYVRTCACGGAAAMSLSGLGLRRQRQTTADNGSVELSL